jgi:putative ABC transport system substrate-binding protein
MTAVRGQRSVVSSQKSEFSRSPTLSALLLALFSACAMLFAFSFPAQTQQRGKIPRVGVLGPGSAPNASTFCENGFRHGMRQLGWIEGQNILLEGRYGEFRPERLRDLAADLVRAAPDVIWTHSPHPVHAAKQATTTIPIVIGVASDLVEQGIVKGSLARPAGNITGMELRDLEIMGKRLELLKEALPSASRVAVLVDPTNSTHARIPASIEVEARTLKIRFHRHEVSTPKDIDSAFAAIRADAVMIPEGAMFSTNRGRIMNLALSKRLPTAAGGQQFAEAGGLLAYGANIRDTCQRSAAFVDKILKGSKPGDLPVERPTKFEMIVNLKTAKQIGLTIPPNVLARADKVIK